MKVVLYANMLLQRLIAAVLLLLPVYPSRAGEPPPLSTVIVGREFSYVVRRGDSLTSVGARFGVEVKTIAFANGLSPMAPLREGQELRIDNRHIVPTVLADGIVINIPQRMLFHFKPTVGIRFFPVGLGRRTWPTPTGTFTIVSKRENPSWHVPKSIQEEMRREGKTVTKCVPPGPDNPLGAHWLGLSIPGYGIHSTIAPTSVYNLRTHGCIRLHPDDIAEIFPYVKPGTPGEILYRRLMVAKVGSQVFLEVHRDFYRKDPHPRQQLLEIIHKHDLSSFLDWDKAKEIIDKQEGVARAATSKAAAHRSP